MHSGSTPPYSSDAVVCVTGTGLVHDRVTVLPVACQIVMEGFVSVRLKPWVRRLTTRLTVIVPAVITVLVAGERGVDLLLTLSQVSHSRSLPPTLL